MNLRLYDWFVKLHNILEDTKQNRPKVRGTIPELIRNTNGYILIGYRIEDHIAGSTKWVR